MTFAQGQLTTADLSPNAGILGTQIADKTIRLRNLSEDTFKVVNPGGTAASVVLANGSYTAVKTWTTTVAHNQKTIPGVFAFVDLSTLPSLAVSTGLSPVPGIGMTATSGLGANVYLPGYIADVSVDATNLYFTVSWMYGALTLANTYTVAFRYYLLVESASAS